MGRLVNTCSSSQYARLRISVPRIGVIGHPLFTRFVLKAVTSQHKDPKARFGPAAALRFHYPRIWGRHGDNESMRDVTGEEYKSRVYTLRGSVTDGRILARKQ